jgi:hypothetical protein
VKRIGLLVASLGVLLGVAGCSGGGFQSEPGWLAGVWDCEGKVVTLTGSDTTYRVSDLGGESHLSERDEGLVLQTMLEQNGWTELVYATGEVQRSLDFGRPELVFDDGISWLSGRTCRRR